MDREIERGIAIKNAHVKLEQYRVQEYRHQIALIVISRDMDPVPRRDYIGKRFCDAVHANWTKMFPSSTVPSVVRLRSIADLVDRRA